MAAHKLMQYILLPVASINSGYGYRNHSSSLHWER